MFFYFQSTRAFPRWASVLVFSVPLCLSVRAADKPENWIEVRSPHFTVVTNGNAKQARNVAEHFEQMRGVMQRALTHVRVDPSEPLVILAVKNEKDLRALLPEYWETKGHQHPQGVFVSSEEKNYVALRLDAQGDNPYQTIYHEYVHAVERLNFERLPLWLSEGWAEFWGNTIIQDKQVGFGRPIPADLQFLRSNRKIPLEILLTADHSSPYYNEAEKASLFYSQSWELVHYLYEGDRGAHLPALAEYLRLLSQNVGDLEAAQRAFGDFHQLAKNLDGYSNQGAYFYFTMKAPFVPQEKDFSEREISSAESAAIRGDFHAHMRRPVEARALLNEALREDPKLAGAHESMGFLSFREGNRDEALKWLTQAVELDSKSYSAHYYQAMLSLPRAQAPDQAVEVEQGLRRCIALNPNFAPAYKMLAQFYALRSEKLDQALALARKAAELEPGRLENHLVLATVLLRMEKVAEALSLGQRVLAAARSPEDRQAATAFLANVQSYQSFLDQKKKEQERLQQAQLSGKTTDADDEEPAQPLESEQPAGKVDQTRIIRSAGKITASSCKRTVLTLTLDVHGQPLTLRASNYWKTDYTTTHWQPPQNFNPCTDLNGRTVNIQYHPAAGKNSTGEIVSIEVQR